MRKKIIAGVLSVSLLFGAAEVLPNGSFTLGNDIVVSAATSGSFEYKECSDGTVEITKYTGSAANVSVPAKIAGKTVAHIGKSAFMNCTKITTVTLPSGLLNIGDDAFNGCSNMTSITIPSSVKLIGNYAFYKCGSLKGITLSSNVKSIGDFAFYGCKSITSFKIPNSVTSVGGYLFENCESLKSVTIGEGITAISDDMFSWCTSLTNISIPSTVTTIGWRAFTSCKSLKSLTIPSSVTNIKDEAFSNCYALTSVTIPSSVKTIGSKVFSGCSKLTIYGSSNAAQDSAAECGVKYIDLRMYKCKITLGYTSHAYCGKALKPTVTVKNTEGQTLVQDIDFTVSYSGNINAGTATVTISGMGKYTGSIKKTFTIKALNLSTSDARTAISASSYNYTGSAIRPAIKVGYKDGTVVSSDQYTVTYANNTKVGLATITVKGKTANVKGTCTKTFVIKPNPGTITVSSPSKNSIKASWTKNTSASGYEIVLSKDKNFKTGVVKYNISNVNTTTAASAKMKSGDVWYVAYRPYITVNGVKYGDYSSVKTITIK
ncbi:Leucine rich repeat-containing protein [Ruminococcus sp. YE71]|uniref:leucine-rich repeat domain-containing protein n=1 Tax=unclassified Ruminococcus TaxID=2608920 RepID=UPI00088AEC8A|nr:MULTISPECIES: leucine-rich repeat domain-containing protein [unclassified Ruminococcus]SDA29878.1 Leucine rich repeat-containing protein [Ruminococcus sp. YE78]SFW48987.1 Leucine rich repeat-containing protein [Ruminococcus sp. YE71]